MWRMVQRYKGPPLRCSPLSVKKEKLAGFEPESEQTSVRKAPIDSKRWEGDKSCQARKEKDGVEKEIHNRDVQGKF